MDKQEAQFILQSFRPDGADAANADFAEALQMAVEDRDLGAWLADERAADSEFAAALCEVKIPDELKMHILSVMRGETPSDLDQDDEIDALFSDALSEVEPPAGLRDQILAAMHVQVSDLENDDLEFSESTSKDDSPVENEVRHKLSVVKRSWVKTISLAAAAFALGGFFAWEMDLDPPAHHKNLVENESESSSRFSTHDVQMNAGKMLNSKFALDVMHVKLPEVDSWLSENDLPVPKTLPAGLKGLKIMGCKKIQLADGVAASLLCFVKGDGGMVHLVVINNEHIKDAHLPSMDELTAEDCYNCKKTGWNIVRWRDRENTFLLFAKKDHEDEGVIQYF